MNASEPFSFKEIQSIGNFNLQKPQFVEMSDSLKVAYYSYAQPTDKEIVMLYAGAGLYGNRVYQWVAKELQEQYGIGCYIFDIRGHGNSQGPRGDASSITRVWKDVEECLHFVKKKHPTAHVYMAGHSSGAGLIINYAAFTKNQSADGYIFLAPFLGPKSNTARLHNSAEKSFVKNSRTWVYILGAFFPNSFITHLNAITFNYPAHILVDDPLIVSAYTHAMSCATTPYEIDMLLKKITRPVGIFIGSSDEQFLPEAVMSFQKMMPVPVYAKIVEGAAHLSILLRAPELIAEYIRMSKKL